MSSVRMAAAELRRITAGRLPRLAVVAMLCIPVLYGGLYLYANHDPYGRLDQVPAAIVNLDAGATDGGGKHVRLGEDVTDELVQGGALDWHQVSAAQAAQGVQDGRYDVALTLPADFSADLTSSQRTVDGHGSPTPASLVLTTNDANNYLARTIANTVTDRVRDSLASQVGERAADSFLVGLSDVHGQLAKAADGASRLADGARDAEHGAGELSAGAAALARGQQQLLVGTARLDSATGQAASGATKLSDGSAKLSAGLDTLARQTSRCPRTPSGSRTVRPRSRPATGSWRTSATTFGRQPERRGHLGPARERGARRPARAGAHRGPARRHQGAARRAAGPGRRPQPAGAGPDRPAGRARLRGQRRRRWNRASWPAGRRP